MEEYNNRPLTPEYIVNLFEAVMDSPDDWEHNKKRLVEIIAEYGEEQKNREVELRKFTNWLRRR